MTLSLSKLQPYHPAAQDRLPTEAKQSRVEPGQYLDERLPGKTWLLLEEVLVRPAGGAHPDLHFTTDYTLYDCVCDE